MSNEVLEIRDQRGEDDSSLEYYPRMTTWEQVRGTFGVRIHRELGWDVAQPGEYVWKLVGWTIRTGAAILFPHVEDEDGTIYWHNPTNTGAVVFLTWAGAPDFPDPQPLRPDYNPMLAQLLGKPFEAHHALANWTKRETGDADFAMGRGDDWIGGSEGNGPGAIWASAVPPDVPKTEGAHYSDGCSGLGWIGGTVHLATSPIFRKVRKTGDVPPQGNGGYIGVYSHGEMLYHIPAKLGAPADPTFSGLRFEGEEGTIWHIDGVE